MYGSGRRYGKLDYSGADPNSSSYQKTVTSYHTRNASDEAIIQDANVIERTDEISINYEPFGKKGEGAAHDIGYTA